MRRLDEDLIRRKAIAIRTALLQGDIVHSPDNCPFDELPPDRQAPWLALATSYIALFYARELFLTPPLKR